MTMTVIMIEAPPVAPITTATMIPGESEAADCVAFLLDTPPVNGEVGFGGGFKILDGGFGVITSEGGSGLWRGGWLGTGIGGE